MDLTGKELHHMPMVPIVVEQTARGERSYDIYSRLLDNGMDMICIVTVNQNLRDQLAKLLSEAAPS